MADRRSRRDVARANAAAARSKAAAAAAEADKAAAEAKRAEADAKARTAEAAARAEQERIAAAREQARLDAEARKRADDAAAAKEQRDFEAKQGSAQKTAISVGLTVAAAAIGAFIGRKLGLAGVKKAAELATTTIKSVESLGTQAAKLTTAKGAIAGTAKGDKLAAIVNDTYALGKVKTPFASPGYQAPPKAAELFGKLGKPDASAYALPAVNVVHGAGTVYASTQVEDKSLAMGLRAEGTAAIFAGLVGAKSLLAARASAMRPSSQAITSIEAGRMRLIREGLKPAEHVKAAQAVTKPRAPRRVPTSAPAGVQGGSFQRTYTSGPKAGTTEIVNIRR
ncbi:MAG: hypothetical protein AB7K67_00930 [Hyphomicrobiaceae bacterium]